MRRAGSERDRKKRARACSAGGEYTNVERGCVQRGAAEVHCFLKYASPAGEKKLARASLLTRESAFRVVVFFADNKSRRVVRVERKRGRSWSAC